MADAVGHIEAGVLQVGDGSGASPFCDTSLTFRKWNGVVVEDSK